MQRKCQHWREGGREGGSREGVGREGGRERLSEERVCRGCVGEERACRGCVGEEERRIKNKKAETGIIKWADFMDHHCKSHYCEAK